MGTRTGQKEDQLPAEWTVGHSEVIGALTGKPGSFIHGFTKSLHSSLCSSVGDAHKALHLKAVSGRDVFLTIPFRAALGILLSGVCSTAQPVEGHGCSLGWRSMGVLWGELSPSCCPSLALGVETPQLEGLSPPPAAGAGCLIVDPSWQFWLCPSHM